MKIELSDEFPRDSKRVRINHHKRAICVRDIADFCILILALKATMEDDILEQLLPRKCTVHMSGHIFSENKKRVCR